MPRRTFTSRVTSFATSTTLTEITGAKSCSGVVQTLARVVQTFKRIVQAGRHGVERGVVAPAAELRADLAGGLFDLAQLLLALARKMPVHGLFRQALRVALDLRAFVQDFCAPPLRA